MLIVYLILGGLLCWLVIKLCRTVREDKHEGVEGETIDSRHTVLTQGDLCPHCGLIIMMPSDLEPKCLGCGEVINSQK